MQTATSPAKAWKTCWYANAKSVLKKTIVAARAVMQAITFIVFSEGNAHKMHSEGFEVGSGHSKWTGLLR